LERESTVLLSDLICFVVIVLHFMCESQSNHNCFVNACSCAFSFMLYIFNT